MSMPPQDACDIPEETVQVARAAFPQGNRSRQMRDDLGPLFSDPLFTPLFPRRGQPAESPARLALITLMQFPEGLSDRQAADAVRGRIDWKYALALELTDPGFDASVLSAFRTRLIAGHAEALLFETMLTRLRAVWFAQGPGAPTDGLHPRPGVNPDAQSSGVRGGDVTPRPQHSGCRRAGLVAGLGSRAVV